MPKKQQLLSPDQIGQMTSSTPDGSASSDPETQAIDAAVQRAFAPQAPEVQNLQQSMGYATTQDQDQYARLLDLQKKTGVAPQLGQAYQKQLQQGVDRNSIDYPQFVQNSPRTAAWASNPDNAAVSGVSEVQRLGGIEQQRNQALRVAGLTPSQQQAVFDERARVAGQGTMRSEGLLGMAWSEGKSLGGNIDAGVAGLGLPFVDAAGVAVQGGLESAEALIQKAGSGDSFDLGDRMNDIWNIPRTFAVQKHLTNPVRSWLAEGIKTGPQQYLQDASGQSFENPDYHAYNPRGIVNAVSQAPGALAAMYATGGLSSLVEGAAGVSAETAGVERLAGAQGLGLEAKALPAILSTQGAQSTYADARSKGADQQTAILAALESGITNYALMGTMPGAVPAASLRGAVGQWAGRSAAMGISMTGMDNAIAKSYDPDRGMLDGLPASIAQMAAFEGVGSMSNIIDLAADSKLRTRAPEKFQEAMQHVFGDDPSLRIPAENFNSYFAGKEMNPQAVAAELGSTNYTEAHLSGGDVEIPTENFISKLDPEHQRALLPDIVDPAMGRTVRQDAQYQKELAEFKSGDGPQKLIADLQAADAETVADPEHLAVKADLQKRYTDAGRTPAQAETTATAAAADIGNLAKGFQMKPTEALAMFNPKVVMGEAPEGAQESESPGTQAPAAAEFKTAKGSVYKVNEDGTTTRNKAFRPEHGDEEQGPQKTSEQTFYVTPGDAEKLGEFQAQGAGSKSISAVDAGRVGVKYEEGKDAGKFEKRTVVGIQSSPAEGLIPVELWEGGKKAHFGNAITEVTKGAATPAVREIPKVATPEEIAANGGRIPFGKTGSMKRADIKLAPDQFQYKLGTDAETGTTDQFADVGKYDPELAGTSHIWYDPNDSDQAYMVNGHHRYELAERSGAEDMNVMPIDAKSAREARAKGALFNIADGKGTSFDAAKYFRDSGDTPETLAARNISLKKGVAREGFAMSRLSPDIFDDAVQGRVDKSRAVALGEQTGDHAVQEETLKKVREKEAAGSHVSDAWVKEYARQIELSGGAHSVEDSGSLFGGMTTESLIDQRTDVTSYVREKLADDKRLFGGLTDEKKAAKLGEVKGQKINAKKNALIAEQADNARLAFEVQSRQPGEVNDAINDAAKRLKDGDPKKQVLADAYDRIGAALREADSGGKRAPDGNLPTGTGGDPGAESEVGKALFQTDEEGNRQGWLRVLPDGSIEVGKTKIGNESTDLHELLGHGYLKVLNTLFKQRGDLASETMKADRQKILDFLGAKDLDSLTTEQNERFTEATLQYLREGKVPNAPLRAVFQRIAVWLQSIFTKASDLGVEISPELRGVMDRRFAADDAVGRAETEAGPRLFSSPEEAGWTQEQFDRYAEDNNMSAAQASAHILGMINEATLRDRTQDWRDEENTVRQAVTEQLDAHPEYEAIRSLRKGALDDGTPLTINRDALVKLFGEERVKELQKTHPGLYRNEREDTTAEDPEIVAERFGYNSAEQMLRAIEAAPRRSAAIETAVRDYMTAKHGDIRYDGTLDDQARLALENDSRGEALHAQLKALKQKVAGMTGQRDALRAIEVAPLASYREAAQQMIAKKSAADLNPTRHLDAMRKYSREAREAFQRGDAQAAADATHKELMNHYLFREATKEKEFVGTFEAYAKRVQKTAAQQKLGLAGPEYLAQVNKLMSRYGMANPPTEAPQGTLADWVRHERDVLNKNPAIPDAILDESRTANYRSIPLSELHQVRDAIVNMRALASQELRATIHGRQVVYAKAANDMIEAARTNNKSKPLPFFDRNATVGQKVLGYLRRGEATIKRMEFMIERLDGGKTGPWHDNVFNPAADSQGKEYALHEAATKVATESLEKMTKEQRARMQEKVLVDGVAVPMTRHDIVSMALNMGNDGNLERLTATFQDPHYTDRGFDPSLIDKIKNNGMLSRDEWQWIQDKWDMLKPLGQEQYDLERRKTGLPPLMVTPTPLDVMTSDGPMHLNGGYYTVHYDPKYSARGAESDGGTTAQNLLEKGYSKAVTSRDNMKARTGYAGPLMFDYEQTLTQHVAKVVKDITHRDLVQAGNKLLMDQGVRDAIRETLGPEAEAQFMPWLRTLVNDKNGSVVQGMAAGADTLRVLRTNLVKASLTFNLHTTLLQLTHASAIFNEVSPMEYAKAMTKFLAHPMELSQEIRDASPNEMRWRGDNLDRDLQTSLHNGSAGKGIGTTLAKAGMMPVQLMDHLLSFPFWDAVYQRELKTRVDLPEDEAHYQASHIADAAVRTGLGANAPKDIPPVMRNDTFWKLVTSLGGFENLKYNQIERLRGDFFAPNRGSLGARAAKLTFGAACAFIIPSILGAYISGRRPGEDQNAGEWAAMRALLFPVETIPLLGQVVKAWETKGDVQFSPVANIATRAVKTGIEATSDKEDKDWTGIGLDALQTAMEAAGVVGTAQAFKTTHYVRKANAGKIDDPNVWDAVAGSASEASRGH